MQMRANLCAISLTALLAGALAHAAPQPVIDLRPGAIHIRSVSLVWTAPGDVGLPGGTAAYDLRYSIFPIDEMNWPSATAASPQPVPTAPGATERHQLLECLQPDTLYYFAIRTLDDAIPPNESALSNVAQCRTMPAPAPVTMRNPWLVNDRAADPRNLTTMGASYVNAYTPDGLVPPASDEAKAINIYNNQKRRLYHWADEPPGTTNGDINNPVYCQNVFGWALCGRHASQACTIANAAGLTERRIGLPGHWIYEIFYGGKWHAFDTMTTMYVYNKAAPANVASCAEMKADSTLLANAMADGRACPGFLLCGDTVSGYQSMVNSWSSYGSGAVANPWSMNMDVRFGESFQRTWEAWQNQHPTAFTDADSGNIPGPDAPYHHECQRDYQDTVNYPYWEPYGQIISFIHTSRATYRRWANGTYDLAPDFRCPAYQAMAYSRTNVATFHDDGLTPDLHLAAVGTGEIVFRIKIPFYLTDANISGDFYRHDSGDAARIYFSSNGTSWTQVWTTSADGTTTLTNFNLRSQVFGKWEYYIKIQLAANGSKTDAGVSNLVISTIFEHNKGCMAYLDKGVNHVTVTFDNPQDLTPSTIVKITYKWKENYGAGWTVDGIQEQYVTTSPATLTITTGGVKVPRTEYIRIELIEPPLPDPVAPGAVTDLAASNVDWYRLDLSWTATGDDGMTGRATRYDVRYSTSPITELNFDAAAPLPNVPLPQAPGSTEDLPVAGLAASTTYYFAIKVCDEGGNLSDLSNMLEVTTLPPDIVPPGAIVSLRAQPGSQSNSIDLTWTAPGDDDQTGTAAGYEIRYSSNPITPGNFAAATLVASPPAPEPGGSTQGLMIAGLTPQQRYYVAIKARDEVPNVSLLSNVSHAQASGMGATVLQRGLDGYTTMVDTYLDAGSPTTAYGTSERMRVCGFEDMTPLARARGLVRFDVMSIPPETPIARATLYLYSYNQPNIKGNSGYYGVYRLTRTWSESNATWNKANTNVTWTTPGGDFEATPDATAPKDPNMQVGWYAFDVTSRVQQWVQNPFTNLGWLIKCTDENFHNQDEFYQSDTTDAQHRPMLVITDTVLPAPGDVDADGDVDIFDVIDTVNAFGSVPGDATWNPGADFDANGMVDIFDVIDAVTNFGSGA